MTGIQSCQWRTDDVVDRAGSPALFVAWLSLAGSVRLPDWWVLPLDLSGQARADSLGVPGGPG